MGAERKLNTLVSLLAMELFEHHLINFQLLENELCQKLKSILNILSIFFLTVVSLSIISRIVLRVSQTRDVNMYLVMLFILMQLPLLFETLQSHMILAPVLLIPKMGQDADLVVATDANKVGIDGVLLQEDTSRSLRPCAYGLENLKIAKQGKMPMVMRH